MKRSVNQCEVIGTEYMMWLNVKNILNYSRLTKGPDGKTAVFHYTLFSLRIISIYSDKCKITFLDWYVRGVILAYSKSQIPTCGPNLDNYKQLATFFSNTVYI